MRYIEYAPLALEAANIYCVDNKYKHISIIISNKSILAIGTNSYNKTHPLNKKLKYRGDFIHAELDAYCKVRHKNNNLILINFRFTKNNQLALAKPCEYCLPWCINIFDKIYYSTDYGFLAKLHYD